MTVHLGLYELDVTTNTGRHTDRQRLTDTLTSRLIHGYLEADRHANKQTDK